MTDYKEDEIKINKEIGANFNEHNLLMSKVKKKNETKERKNSIPGPHTGAIRKQNRTGNHTKHHPVITKDNKMNVLKYETKERKNSIPDSHTGAIRKQNRIENHTHTKQNKEHKNLHKISSEISVQNKKITYTEPNSNDSVKNSNLMSKRRINKNTNRNQFQQAQNEKPRIINENTNRNQFQREQNEKPRIINENTNRNQFQREQNEKPRPENNNYRKKVVGYRFLENLLSKDIRELIEILANNKSGFMDILKQDNLKHDWIMIIINLLSKLKETDFIHLRIPVLTSSCEHIFLNQLNIAISKLPSLKKSSIDIIRFIENILVFCQLIFETLPHQVNKFEDILIALDLNMEGVKKYKQITFSEEIDFLFSRLQQQFFDVKKEMSKSSQKKNKSLTPPNDYRLLNIIPTLEEINEKDPFIRSNIIKDGYNNVEHYLDVQFRLLKEDFIHPLRATIDEFRNNKIKKFRNIYFKTQFKSSKFINGSCGHLVIFEQKNKKFDLTLSQKFMYGSLLAFSHDDFHSVIFATVADRKNLKDGEIVVFLLNDDDVKDIYQKDFVMIESDVYFEPYYHVMKKFKTMNSSNFPLEKYIINVNKIIDPPKYIKDVQVTIDSYNLSLLDKNQWPSAHQLKLDNSQYIAFQLALTSELCLIQGPPGTGKTFIGLKIVKVLLENFKNLQINKPILVVCYTNHALDQFLEGILIYTNNLVRVGGRSKSEMLDNYNISHMRRTTNKSCHQRELYYDVKFKQTNFIQKMNDINNEIEYIINQQGVISLSLLSKIIDKETKEQLPSNELFLQWLEIDLQIEMGYENFQNFQNNKEKEEIESNISDEINFDIDEDLPDYILNEEEENIIQNKPFEFTIDIPKIKCEIETLQKQMYDLKETDQYDILKLHTLYQEYIVKISKVNYYSNKLKNYKYDENVNINFRHNNIWNLSGQQRWLLYFSWASTYINMRKDSLEEMLGDYFEVSNQLEELKIMEDYYILKKAQVIGMTTSLAARNQNLLNQLGCKIVIVEEAAEIMEAHIVASLSEHCEHLILIGDHQQLKPKIATYELGKNHNFDISLFERLVLNNIDNAILQTQHRMRPEICSLLVPAIYENLRNHLSVFNYESILGVSSNLAFITHNVKETENNDTTSHLNEYEADFLLQFCQHLILQGYTSEQITILTAYSGQMFLMKKKSYKMPLLNNVKIIVVDNFQGEENDIILLSLVRSNPESNIGFLKTANRVCVALSRAKKGLYIIGNMQNLTMKGSIWIDINKALMKLKAVDPFLLLKCQIHPDQIRKVSKKEDFFDIPEGGCALLCHSLLKCGHTCKNVCHIQDREHNNKICYEKCERDAPKCYFEHKCPQLCREVCRPCEILIPRNLDCGHKVKVPCHQLKENYKCESIVKIKLKDCEHENSKPCYLEENKVNCQFKCQDRLPCGHACILNCHKSKDPDHNQYICKKPCAKKNNKCSENHECTKLCFEECGDCDFNIKKKRFCGHVHNVKCSLDINNDEFKCDKPCKRSIPSCGHHCKNRCFQPCGNCLVQVEKKIEECGHVIKTFCHKTPNSSDCNQACKKFLSCGHICNTKCSLPCTTKCNVMVNSSLKSLCGHPIKIPCYLNNNNLTQDILLLYCTQPCINILSCEHICKGTCGSCFQGRLHEICKENCGRTLICSHECKSPCAENCPPCEQKCQYECSHSKCSKRCGEPCFPCQEKCDWACKHKRCTKKCFEECNRQPCYEPCEKILACNHKCIGFCGEPCPTLCRKCNKEEVETIFFGNEDNPEARFVLLEDCNHIIESDGLEEWFKSSSQGNNEIQLLNCPICKTKILKNKRFSNIIKKIFKKIADIKVKYFGKPEEIKRLQDQLKCKVLVSRTFISDYDKDQQQKLTQLFQNIENKFKKLKTKTLSLNEINTIDTKINILQEIFNLCKKNHEAKISLRTQIHMIFTQLFRMPKLTNQVINDLNNELLRFKRLGEFIQFNENLSTTTELKNQYFKVKKHLYSIEKYNEKIDKMLIIDMKHLSKYMNVLISEEERKMIVKAMSFQPGHWYECPNGHVYCITECGGAMVQGKCNECGENIGGSQHQLLRTNKVATKMDGSTRPAYPDPDYYLARNMN